MHLPTLWNKYFRTSVNILYQYGSESTYSDSFAPLCSIIWMSRNASELKEAYSLSAAICSTFSKFKFKVIVPSTKTTLLPSRCIAPSRLVWLAT